MERRRSQVLRFMRLRGVVIGIALLAFAAAACSGGSGDAETLEATAALRVLAGTVEVQPPSADFALAVDGQALDEGFTIRTAADGRAAIEYFDGSVTRLDENTTFTIVTLQILDNDEQSKVIEGEQSEGSTYNRVTELTDSASRFDVTTPTATASVQGTIYAIFIDPATGATTVAVLDGAVAVGEDSIPAGFMVTVNEDGTTSDPVPIPEDLIGSDWIVFNCEEDGGIVDENGDCIFGTPDTTTTTVADTTTTTVADTTTTTVAPTTTTTTTTLAPTTTTTTTTVSPTTTTTTTTTTVPPTTTTTTTTIPEPVLDYIVISPDEATVSAGEAQEYTAEGFDEFDTSMGAVEAEYDLDGSPCNGALCSSTTAGEYTVTGTFEGKTDTATLTVEAGELDSIVISPDEVTVGPDEAVEYSAEGFDEYGNSVGAVDAEYEISGTGSCEGSSCSATDPDEYTVTGAYDEGISDTATLIVEDPCAEELLEDEVAAPAIVYDEGCGTAAAEDTLGGYDMTSFEDDTRDEEDDDEVGEGRVITPSGDDLGFSTNVNHESIGSGWVTWSHSGGPDPAYGYYYGDVYIVPGGVLLTLTLPAGTLAFSFFVEPNDFDVLDITATAQDGTTSGPVPVNGASGATFFGFYTTDPETPLECVTVSIDESESESPGGFAIGEFAINQDPDAFGDPAPSCGA